ncbi:MULTISPECIES: hypothetical protein [Acinetobacter]|uniref:ApeA N-terminal domain-containing protein n=1 Tax=Acinetobacter higginsii TaxID=70347 RepID=N9RQQ7_9GAMM|nr:MULTISPECIES: hypothetical protein [Acinetobacter]ENX60308.1 hypothetical protein F902_00848 [Acinetobacter higginsii]
MISNKDIQNCLENNFTFDVLNGNLKNAKNNYSCTGRITQKNGKINFYGICNQQTNFENIFNQNNGLSGELVDDDEYYNLQVSNITGSFHSSHISPSFVYYGTSGCSIDAELSALEYSGISKSSINTFNFYYKNPINLEVNHGYPLKINLINFISIEIKNIDSKHGLISINSSKNFSYEDAKNILKGLTILFSENLFSFVVRTSIENDRKVIQIKSTSNKESTFFPAPIPLKTKKDLPNLIRFLNNQIILSHKEQNFFFNLYSSIYKLRDAYLDIQALNVCVCIESILKKYYAKSIKVPEKLLNRITKAKAELNRVKSHFDETTLSDLNYSLDLKLKPSPKQILKSVEYLDSKFEISWTKVRNSTAHGVSLSAENQVKLQISLDHFYTCIELFYKLWLIHIGYSGDFYQYSIKDWPRKNHRNLFEMIHK